MFWQFSVIPLQQFHRCFEICLQNKARVYLLFSTIFNRFLRRSWAVQLTLHTLGACSTNEPAKPPLLWTPGHPSIAGNEKSDACAKLAPAISSDARRPVTFAAASALIRRTLTDPPPSHCRTNEVYTKTFSWVADCRATSTRRDAVPLARRRSGHTSLRLNAYVNQLDTTVDPKCPNCGEGPQTVEHWLQRCPNQFLLTLH